MPHVIQGFINFGFVWMDPNPVNKILFCLNIFTGSDNVVMVNYNFFLFRMYEIELKFGFYKNISFMINH